MCKSELNLSKTSVARILETMEIFNHIDNECCKLCVDAIGNLILKSDQYIDYLID